LTLYQILWGATILVGVFAALAPDTRAAVGPRIWGIGIVLGTVAALGQGGGAVLTRKAFDVARLAGQSIDGGTAAYQRILGGLLLTAVFLFAKRGRQCFPALPEGLPAADRPWRQAWPWVIANALAGPTLGVAFYQWALAIPHRLATCHTPLVDPSPCPGRRAPTGEP
jgi:hypothetical protein